MAKVIGISYREKVDGISSDETMKRMNSMKNTHFGDERSGLGNFLIRVFREWEIIKLQESQRNELGKNENE